MRISDWSSDVCSSDLFVHGGDAVALNYHIQRQGVSSHWTPVKQQKSTLNHPESQGNPRVAPVDRPVDRAVEGFIAPTTTGRVPGTGRDSTDSGVEIGRASCRERVCRYVSIPVVAVSLKPKTTPT